MWKSKSKVLSPKSNLIWNLAKCLKQSESNMTIIKKQQKIEGKYENKQVFTYHDLIHK